MKSMIKKDKIIYFIIVTCLILSLALSVLVITKNITLNRLNDESKKLNTKISKNNGSINVETDTVNKIISINKDIILKDEKITSEFFKPAFSWTSGIEYDKMRANYIEILGDKSTFTNIYLPEDLKIETQNGELSYIDHEELKMKLGEIKIVPLKAEGNSIKYAGFINYYPYKDKSDLVNLDALTTSEAIIKFTISGEELERKITEVEAWNGFIAKK